MITKPRALHDEKIKEIQEYAKEHPKCSMYKMTRMYYVDANT